MCISVQNCINVFWQPLNGSTGSITSKNDDNARERRKPGTICASKWVDEGMGGRDRRRDRGRAGSGWLLELGVGIKRAVGCWLDLGCAGLTVLDVLRTMWRMRNN